jgi:hypothetical protein
MANEHSSGRSNSSVTQDKNSSWVGGWYVFEDGNVVGPLDASDAFSRTEKTASGQARMVSRKGFTQWYPLQDFAAIHAMAGRYSDFLGQSANTSNDEAKIGVVAKKIGPINNEAKNHLTHDITINSNNLNANNIIGTITNAQKELSSTTSGVGERVKFPEERVTSESVATTRKLSAKERKRLQEDERRSRKLLDKQAEQSARSQSNINTANPAVSFDQQYLQVASRLRLGRPGSPGVRAMIYFPLSLGTYWWAWLSKTGEEVSWHLNGASRMNFILPMWMCMIPGVHLILAYFVARMVRQMEEQNGYITVNPWLATVAAVFPPLYIGMIQSALNRHWRLHVYHSATR